MRCVNEQSGEGEGGGGASIPPPSSAPPRLSGMWRRTVVVYITNKRTDLCIDRRISTVLLILCYFLLQNRKEKKGGCVSDFGQGRKATHARNVVCEMSGRSCLGVIRWGEEGRVRGGEQAAG